MPIPTDYLDRVYAGVLGKIIGVYLGRPFEGWTYDKIVAELGDINYYVHEKRGVPLIVTDDDISGTFTFIRALEDYGCTAGITAAQIGRTWMNYLIENKTVLWWGGMGNSTEHTAYLRLKHGVEAPASGSIATNGKVVAEQIGAQIFIDGWAMVAPGDPALAVELARKAGSVSHDGEAIYGAQVVAAIESMAFAEKSIDKLLDAAVGFIPKDSVIYRMIGELRALRKSEPDWRKARQWLEANYGYDKFGGNCHMVPNHGLIILALLWSGDSFAKSLMIVNTCGWDTDCNSANVGCIMGIKNGLADIDAGPDWRGPVADRVFIPTADGGSCVNDAAAIAVQIANMGLRLAGKEPIAPKNGARFHFELPGSVQGFGVDGLGSENAATRIENAGRALAVHYANLAPRRFARVATRTFVTPEDTKMGGYGLIASPTLYGGQTIRASVSAERPLAIRLYVNVYGKDDQVTRILGPEATLPAAELRWQVPDTAGQPIVEVGIEATAASPADGTIKLHYLTWDGEPSIELKNPGPEAKMWQRAWVDAASAVWHNRESETYRVMQNEGRGLLIQGTRDWRNYTVSARLTPHMARSFGVAARVGGLGRYYALLVGPGQTARLVKVLDGERTLASAPFTWQLGQSHDVSIEVVGTRIRARIGEGFVLEAQDQANPLTGGGIALVCEEGRVASGPVAVRPAFG